MSTPAKLTAYSHGSGCGCKIAPATLEQIMQCLPQMGSHPNLLVGHSTKDDAAVYDLGNGQALVFSVDCFTPIVDDAIDFGMIAAANALSDIYAMGGQPIMALAILGWPVDTLSAELAGQVLQGGQQVCEAVNIPLAGGHSIDTPEPFFGLAVNGLVSKERLLTNAGAQEGDLLFLTKPIGMGIVSAAAKRGKAKTAHMAQVSAIMKTINQVGYQIAQWEGIHAMTDITGFGLLGHLIELCEAANLSAHLNYPAVPLMPDEVLRPYLQENIAPDNTFRNFNSYAAKTSDLSAEQLTLLCDPQTNGGLLIAVSPEQADSVQHSFQNMQLPHLPIGQLVKREQKTVVVGEELK